jgi:hypothetical protein
MNVSVRGRSLVVYKGQRHLVSEDISRVSKSLTLRTDILWRPHNNHVSLSLEDFDDHPSSTEDSGRTLSVMMYTVVSLVTASMNLRTSGCRMVRSFFNALFARGRCFLLCGFEVESNSNTETGDPSSCMITRTDGRNPLESLDSRAW